jgi:hypothetical protein
MPPQRQVIREHSNRWLRFCLGLVCLLGFGRAQASVSLLLEEPFGAFGSFNPTGHAAIYLNNVCADAPTHLRLCRAGEMGVVISRYHHVHGYDWVAMPLLPYLYAVDDLADVPAFATREMEADLRDTYRRDHLLDIAPSRHDGSAPKGEWIQLAGAAYDRRIYGFQLDTTREQEERLIATLNDSHNRSHFNLFFRNCADFSRSVLRGMYPGSIPRNSPADFWLTTPKHLAKSVEKYGISRPELGFETFQIPQIPGSIPRSHRVDGIAESLVRSKKYLVPLAILSPTTAASLVAAYVGTGRFKAPKDAPMMSELSPEPTGIVLEQDGIALGSTPATLPENASLVCTEPVLPVASLEAMTGAVLMDGGSQ